MATLQNIGKLKYRGKDGLWHPLPVVVQDTGGGVSTISGKGTPTSETQGEVNQLYRDEDTQKLYICTSTDGGYTWAEVSGGGSGGSVDIDATLTKEGQAADAKAAGDAIGKKIDKAQGTGNAGKILGIGADGNVTPQDKPVQALAGASAPTTATAGVVGQEYYVIANGEVTEMYVCTAAANGTYTWGKVEFGAEETDPTVPAWAKEAQKPSYTASEVGADPSGTAAAQVTAHNTAEAAHNDIRLLISGLTDRLNALADSDDTTLDQLSEVVSYIKSNRSLIEAITTSKVSVADIVDNLTTNVTNKPLSAAQGVELKALIDGIVIPDKLPNPNALTFTGAVTGSYDGSAPLSVEIPSGGGSSSWETVIDTTLTEEAGIDTGEMPGKTEVMCLFAVPKHTAVILQTAKSGAFGASLNGFNMAGATYGKVGCIYCVKINGHAVQFTGAADTSSATPTIDTTTRTPVTIALYKPSSADNDTPLKLAASLPTGTQIKVFVR